MNDYFFFQFFLYALAPQALTAEFVFDRWENRSWGLHDVDHTREEIRIDLASDGSYRFRNRRRSYRNYILPERTEDHEYIESQAERRAYSINHGTRHVLWEMRHGAGDWPPKIPADPRCFAAARDKEASVRFAGETRVGSVRAMRYLAWTSSEIREYLFAPELGCGLAGLTTYEPNGFGLPVKIERLRLKKLELREPEAWYFTPPADYASRQVSSLTCGNGSAWD